MVGLITNDMERSHDFYGRLGVDFGGAAGRHREAKIPGLTFFLDDAPTVWHPRIEGRPYPWLLEFFFESIADLRSKLDELVAAGYQLIDEPYVTGFGMWFAFIADPDGNTVLLSAEQAPRDD
jgi:catechol 2,3-dioxygenase-like lactoylglutathione lyase family enzyme